MNNSLIADTPGLLGVPSTEYVFGFSVVTIMEIELPPGSLRRFKTGATGPGPKRDALIEEMLTQPALRWIAFFDSDMLFRPDTVRALLAAADRSQADVVGGLYVGRATPFVLECGDRVSPANPIGGYEFAKLPTTITQAAWCGAGCLLVRRAVLEALGHHGPWFGSDEEEDIRFCMRVREAGFTIVVEPAVQPAHVALLPVTTAHWLAQRARAATKTVSLPGGVSLTMPVSPPA